MKKTFLKILANIIKEDLEGFCISPETGHGWIYGKSGWWISF